MVTIRPAAAADGPFLRQMLAVAAAWQPGATVQNVDEIVARPGTAHYLEGWPGEGDLGFVAEDDGQLGATWWRYFSPDDPGYGFVDESSPELTIGVVAAHRHRGVGGRLLGTLIAEARRLLLPAISLSVDPDNPAARLYQRHGFRTVGASGTSMTMLLDLDP